MCRPLADVIISLPCGKNSSHKSVPCNITCGIVKVQFFTHGRTLCNSFPSFRGTKAALFAHTVTPPEVHVASTASSLALHGGSVSICNQPKTHHRLGLMQDTNHLYPFTQHPTYLGLGLFCGALASSVSSSSDIWKSLPKKKLPFCAMAAAVSAGTKGSDTPISVEDGLAIRLCEHMTDE